MRIAEPLGLPCGVVLPNRLAKSAMSERIAEPSRLPNARHETLYRRWAFGGAGLCITGNVMVDPAHIGETGNVALDEGTDLAPFRAWAQAGADAPLWMQINHPGRQAPRTLVRRPVSAGAVAMKGMGGAFARPRALDAAEIRGIVDRFVCTAERAAEAGFTGVQIHGAHGYLVSQFLSPLTNPRDDAWGGDAERRRHFLLEIVRRIRDALGAGFPIGVKLNSADFQRGGFTAEASMAVVEALDASGIDLLEISGGTYERPKMFSEDLEGAAESTQRREAFFLDYAEEVRSRTRLPLMLTGGFRTVQGMEAALASGAIDVVGMARPLAVEPDLPKRLLAGEAEQALPVSLHTGVRFIDSVVVAAWHQLQIERLADGGAVQPRLSRIRAFFWYLRTTLFAGRYRR